MRCLSTTLLLPYYYLTTTFLLPYCYLPNSLTHSLACTERSTVPRLNTPLPSASPWPEGRSHLAPPLGTPTPPCGGGGGRLRRATDRRKLPLRVIPLPAAAVSAADRAAPARAAATRAALFVATAAASAAAAAASKIVVCPALRAGLASTAISDAISTVGPGPTGDCSSARDCGSAAADSAESSSVTGSCWLWVVTTTSPSRLGRFLRSNEERRATADTFAAAVAADAFAAAVAAEALAAAFAALALPAICAARPPLCCGCGCGCVEGCCDPSCDGGAGAGSLGGGP